LKIIRFQQGGDPGIRLGILRDDDIYDLVGDPLIRAEEGRYVAPLSEVTLLAPCQPGKIIAIAINFEGIGGFSENMSEPLVFLKPGSSVCNPGDVVQNPFPELPWWGEAELGVVVKKRTRNISSESAQDAVLGFTIGNDMTVENVEERDHHLARSKCPDGFCPLGPWIDTDFDSSNCLIEGVQNGEVIRRAMSAEQFWQWPKILSWLSTWMTLDPWDVILTGNPPDTVGMRFLSDGDVYTARIKGLGEISNKCVV